MNAAVHGILCRAAARFDGRGNRILTNAQSEIALGSHPALRSYGAMRVQEAHLEPAEKTLN